MIYIQTLFKRVITFVTITNSTSTLLNFTFKNNNLKFLISSSITCSNNYKFLITDTSLPNFLLILQQDDLNFDSLSDNKRKKDHHSLQYSDTIPRIHCQKKSIIHAASQKMIESKSQSLLYFYKYCKTFGLIGVSHRHTI